MNGFEQVPVRALHQLQVDTERRIEIGKDFMFSHGYIKNDFDVRKWAAPEFAEQAAKELLEAKWEKVTSEKLSTPGMRLG